MRCFCLLLAATIWIEGGCRQDMDEQRELSNRVSAAADVPTSGSHPQAPSLSQAPPPQPATLSTQPTSERAQTDIRLLHFDSFVIDTHVDTALRMTDEGFDVLVRNDTGHLDVPRMREGGLDSVFFAIWVDPDDYTGIEAFWRSLSLFNSVHAAAWQSTDVVVVDRVAEARTAVESGRTALFFGVEGAHALGTSDEAEAISRLRTFRALGARYMTITWSKDNPMGHSSTGDHPERGLTELGRSIIEEMERMGIVVDVSHVSDQTFWDIMEIASKPVIASHSSARALSDNPRNMTDDMIRRVAENHGVVCVNFFSYYLDAAYAEERSRIYEENRSAYRDLRHRDLSYTGRGPAYREVAVSLEPDLDVPDVNTIADHIMHIVDIGGAETACLGSDFDGVPELPLGVGDVTALPAISVALSSQGLPDHHIVKILGGNVLRVLQASEGVR